MIPRMPSLLDGQIKYRHGQQADVLTIAIPLPSIFNFYIVLSRLNPAVG